MLSLNWDMCLAEGLMTSRIFLLLFELWVLLAPVQCFQGRPSWHYMSSEVVIPRKEAHHGKGLQAPGWLSYSLHFGGQRHVIHLQRKKILWPRHLLVMTQDDQGALQMDYPFIPSDCYYLGHLEAFPQSMVTVDTCYGGLEGVMKLDDLAYEIKPLKDSHRFEHVVSRIVADVSATGPTHRPGHKEHIDIFSEANFSIAPRMSGKDYASHAGAIKGHVQSSKAMYGIFNNVTKCAKYMVGLFSIVDSFLRSLHIKYYIYLLTIYNTNDPATITDYRVPGGEIHNYYIANFYGTVRPDSSCIVHKDGPHELTVEPVSGSMCQPNCLIFAGRIGRHSLVVATIIANRLGRTMGLAYDGTYCICQRRTTCIMSRYPVITDAFSNCSLVNLQQIIGVPDQLACLFHQNWQYLNYTYTFRRCGNSIVEHGEKCDCGSFKQCYANKCCESSCQFTPGSICDKGTCCTNCTYSPSGTICRTIQNICDLPEYCGGNTVNCPNDTYLQNGTPCTEESFCFLGNCTDPSVQCKEIFGEHAHHAHDACYQINSQNFRFGYCLRSATSLRYTACSVDNMRCGRLQCTNVTHLPRLQEHVSFHQSQISDVLCFGLDEHSSTETTDAGQVRTGTPCGTGKFCDRSACNGTMTAMGYDCTPEKCNFRGACNNQKHCHCHIGWDPPECKNLGSGGSIDSGPPPRKMHSVKQSIQPVIYLRLVFARIYAVIAALLFGVATSVRTLRIIKDEEIPQT
uniref:disintegrin and metalloproteinase domain-containing protein 21-like n=1 Tax=Jaculus jaculus TaxID=51337 RepID=UPI001E1B0228|nr:disintegrin and metalloproteinase domain-containing protein 21-like [Jaculus jaculus]